MLITMIFFAKTAKVRSGILQKLQFHQVRPNWVVPTNSNSNHFRFHQVRPDQVLTKKRPLHLGTTFLYC
jgi:hypothetical protein